ncbi:MAG TPA: glycosyltransferase family 9 protein [Candidatus Acidoferrales bacterium]|nr:glycosyltransferase family 9 protein [Candidatus Acidoferrales bacterium]
MPEPRFLLVRLGSLGDIIHALPAAAALRDAFPSAKVDWVVEPKWRRLLEGNPDLNEVITLDRRSVAGIAATVRKLRAARYTCAVDFQALYKSALLALASGAPRRIGFKSSYAREGLAALCYTETLHPRGPHKVDHNLTLTARAGSGRRQPRFPLAIHAEDQDLAARELAACGLREFFVLNPGGGWRSKCWPARRYAELYDKMIARHGLRGVLTCGPGEADLAREVMEAAADPKPIAIPLALGPLMALLRRARFVVSADTGPLHLAAALGTPVVALFGPTDPARNGPFGLGMPGGARGVAVRNARESQTTYRREEAHSAAMLSITVDQAFQAAEQCMRISA